MNPNRLCAAIALLVLGTGQSHGAGLELTQQGVKELGHGYAGTATLLEDASAIAYNPAGLAGLESSQFTGALTAIYADIDYEAEFIREKIENEYGLEPTRVAGANQGKSRDLIPVPAAYYAHKLTDDIALGIGVYGAFGSGSDYPSDWAGRFHAIETDQTAININPTVAWQATDTLSLGFGAILQSYEARLTNEIDISYLAAESLVSNVEEEEDRGTAEDVAEEVLDRFSRSEEYNVFNDIELDSIAFGFSFGALWEPRDETRVGLNFRSRTSHIAEGEAVRPKLSTPEKRDEFLDELAEDIDEFTQIGFDEAREAAAAAVDERGALGGDLHSRITLPDILTLSVQQGVGERLDLMASATWVNWSVLDEIRLEYTDKTLRGGSDITGSDDDVRRRDLVQPLDFENTIRYGVGARYAYSDRLTLRAGASYDESPLKDPANRTPRAPDNDRLIAGTGVSYEWNERLSLDFSYGWIRIREGNTQARENPAGTQHRASGSSRGTLHNVGAQMNYSF